MEARAAHERQPEARLPLGAAHPPDRSATAAGGGGGARPFHKKNGDAMMATDMKVVASASATEFILAHGGRLWVWAGSSACCGGTRFIEASSEPPAEADRFLPVPGGDFEVFVRAAGPSGLPEELHVDVGG